MHARGSFLASRPRGARTFCRDTFVALCALLLNLCGLIWTIELRIVARLVAHVVTLHKYDRLKLKYIHPGSPVQFSYLVYRLLNVKTFEEYQNQCILNLASV